MEFTKLFIYSNTAYMFFFVGTFTYPYKKVGSTMLKGEVPK